jgi:ribosomal protein S18 acetylase RimI-like enzyme
MITAGEPGGTRAKEMQEADTVLCVQWTAAQGQYELDDDPGRVDRDALWHFLSTEAYWGRWRTRSVVEQQLDGAWRVVGVYDSASGAMIGFARAVSDGAGFAYLADVYVDKEFRGQGLGVELVATMIDRGPGATFRWTLHTSDAHGLYERFGFTQPDRTYLERPGTSPTPEHSVPRPAQEPPARQPPARQDAGRQTPAQEPHETPPPGPPGTPPATR